MVSQTISEYKINPKENIMQGVSDVQIRPCKHVLLSKWKGTVGNQKKNFHRDEYIFDSRKVWKKWEVLLLCSLFFVFIALLIVTPQLNVSQMPPISAK